MREALEALDFVVAIDVAMTETARLADYVPCRRRRRSTKVGVDLLNFEFRGTCSTSAGRSSPPEGVLPEPEIHARLVEALGALTPEDVAPLRAAAEEGRAAFAEAFFAATSANPALGALAPIVLYRTLGPTLPRWRPRRPPAVGRGAPPRR